MAASVITLSAMFLYQHVDYHCIATQLNFECKIFYWIEQCLCVTIRSNHKIFWVVPPGLLWTHAPACMSLKWPTKHTGSDLVLPASRSTRKSVYRIGPDRTGSHFAHFFVPFASTIKSKQSQLETLVVQRQTLAKAVFKWGSITH